jgi:hypothetical protein
MAGEQAVHWHATSRVAPNTARLARQTEMYIIIASSWQICRRF